MSANRKGRTDRVGIGRASKTAGRLERLRRRQKAYDLMRPEDQRAAVRPGSMSGRK